MIEKDEDIEYGKWRQRRLDALDEEIAKDKKQPQFAKHEGPQKYATKDPWPTVPWREDEAEVPTLWGAIVALLITLLGLMVGLLWEVL